MSKGNQHGYHCPKCNCDENIRIMATSTFPILLCSDGTDGYPGDIEWEDASEAWCTAGCGWRGTVKDLVVVPEDASD